MSETLVELSLASIAFVGSHIVMASGPVREPMVEKIGKWPFRILYSLVSSLILAWMIISYFNAPIFSLYTPTIGMKHLTLSVMAVVSFFLVCGFSTAHPTAAELENGNFVVGVHGVFKITRHPVLWGIILWALCHIIANGHVAALIFFGSFALLAIAGANRMNMKRRLADSDTWDAYMKVTSHVPLVAILKGQTRIERGEYRWWQVLLSVGLYAGLLFLHEPIIGRYVMPF